MGGTQSTNVIVEANYRAEFKIVQPQEGIIKLSEKHVKYEPLKGNPIYFNIADIGSSSVEKNIVTIYECAKIQKAPKLTKARPYAELPPQQRHSRELKSFKYTFKDFDSAKQFQKILSDLIRNSIDPILLNNHTRNITVLINPFSGKGNSRKIWASCSDAIQAIDGVKVKVIETKYALHASEFISNLPKEEIPDILILVSGDGLINEVINGLFKRSDAREISNKIQICHLPGGTSNSTACSVGTYSVASAVHSISRRYSVPWDAFAYTIRDSEVKYGCGCVGWGVIADAALGTEHLRFLGSIRISIGSLKAVLSAKKYYGQFVVNDSDTLISTIQSDISDDSQPVGTKSLNEFVPTSFEEALSRNDWKKVGGDSYFLWFASKYSIADKSFVITPKTRGWGGKIQIFFGESCDFSKLKAVQALSKIASGKVEDVRGAQSVTTSAFILKPGTNSKWSQVDGENIGIGLLRVVMLPNLLRVVAAEEVYQEL